MFHKLPLGRLNRLVMAVTAAAAAMAGGLAFPWWAASLISNLAIIMTEYLNRHHVGSWMTVLPQTLPLIVVAQFCLFRAFNGAPHWMIAWAVFTIGNSAMRVSAVSFMDGHSVASWWSVIGGVAIMVGGALLMKTGLR